MRLPDVRPDALTEAQRPVYEAFQQMARSESGAGYEILRPDGTFLGPWSVLLHFPDVADGLGQFASAVGKMQALSPDARQVVVLTVGGHFNAAYEIYAHATLGAQQGLTVDQVATLSAGERPTDLTLEQALATEMTAALLRGGVVPGPLYEAVVATLGQDALDTIVFVTIHYFAICTMLNAYDVSPGSPTSWLTDRGANKGTVTSSIGGES